MSDVNNNITRGTSAAGRVESVIGSAIGGQKGISEVTAVADKAHVDASTETLHAARAITEASQFA